MIIRELLLIIVIFIALGCGVYLIERARFSAKEIALISALAGIAALGRIPFAAVPNAQPTTFLIIVSGAVFGSTIGFVVGVVSTLVSNLFLGHGPWTFFQMLAWGLCGLSAGVVFKCDVKRGSLVLFGFIWGYLFGWTMNLWYWYAFVYPLSFGSWLAANAASFWFDTVHALTNAVFCFIFGPDVVRILTRFRNKLSFTCVGGCREELVC